MINVSVDLMGEQKVILAYFSWRQLLILLPTAIFSFLQLLFVNYPFVSGFAEFGFKILVAILSLAIAAALAYIKFYKYDVYLSQFIINRIKFIRSQKIYTN